MRELDLKQLNKWEEALQANPSLRASLNAATYNGIGQVSLNPQRLMTESFTFNVDIEQGKVTNQKMSGRCWMFASLNVMRNMIIKSYNLENIELSQSYPLFFDKLERCNYFLETMIAIAHEPIDGRVMHHMLFDPINDGGQWDMFVNLVKKYGVVPKYAYPESFNSSHTDQMNKYLARLLRKYTLLLREAVTQGKSEEALYEIKTEAMQKVYDTLVVSLGKPPETFDFVAYDKDHQLIEDKNITPTAFFEKYVGMEIDEYVSIIHAPTKDKPFFKTYTIEHLGNVVEGRIIKHLNLPIEALEELAVKQLKDGHPTWFGCDVGQRGFADKERSILDLKAMEFDKLFQVDLNLSKEDGLVYGDSLMTHAMTFLGVYVDENDVPLRWKVENSWGKDYGYEGYLVMSQDWFRQYMYQVVVHKKYLTEEWRKLYEQEPIVLKPWDPMGSLAK